MVKLGLWPCSCHSYEASQAAPGADISIQCWIASLASPAISAVILIAGLSLGYRLNISKVVLASICMCTHMNTHWHRHMYPQLTRTPNTCKLYWAEGFRRHGSGDYSWIFVKVFFIWVFLFFWVFLEEKRRCPQNHLFLWCLHHSLLQKIYITFPRHLASVSPWVFQQISSPMWIFPIGSGS